MLDFTEAINWALQQNVELEGESTKITVNNPHLLIDKVREYLNSNNIPYDSFSYDDIMPYLPLSE